MTGKLGSTLELFYKTITLHAKFIFSRAYRQWNIKGLTKAIDDKVNYNTHSVGY